MKQEYKSVEFMMEETAEIEFEKGFDWTLLEGPDGKYYEVMPGVVLELSLDQVRRYDRSEEQEEG